MSGALLLYNTGQILTYAMLCVMMGIMQVKALVQELWHRHSSDDLLYAVGRINPYSKLCRICSDE